jgi:hypothetical protein
MSPYFPVPSLEVVSSTSIDTTPLPPYGGMS